jgi:Flp pilus assembly pilin Flp
MRSSSDYRVVVAGAGSKAFLSTQRIGKEETKMNDLLVKLYVAAKSLRVREDGQGMTEYAMTVALIAFGCVAGETAIASSVNNVFVSITATITTGVLRG